MFFIDSCSHVNYPTYPCAITLHPHSDDLIHEFIYSYSTSVAGRIFLSLFPVDP